MDDMIRTNDPAPAMRRETLDELRMLVYHPRHSSDPERPLRFAREFLSRPDLMHATLPSLAEDDARRLVEALAGAFPDRSAEIAARTVRDLLDRPH